MTAVAVDHAGREPSAARSTVVAAGAAVAASLLVEVVDLDPSLGSGRFHASLETADAMVLTFVSAVLVSRLRGRGTRANALMVIGVVVLAVKNLFHAIAIMTVDELRGDHVVVWGTALNGLAGAALLAVAACTADRPMEMSRRRPGAIAAGVALAVVGSTFLLVAAFDAVLPPAFDTLPEDATELALLSGHPVKIALDVATGLLYLLAAIGFARAADRSRDELMRWLSVGSVVAAVAFVDYALFPSRFSELLYGGEIVWIGAIVAVLYGAVREIANTEAGLVRSAVLEERRRVARDLHDGVAQELAFMVSQTSSYLHTPVSHDVLADVLASATRALEETRAAIGALVRPINEPLCDALDHSAADVADRLGARVELDLDPGTVVSPEWRNALTRITREAVSNAVRHGGARTVSVHLRGGHPTVLRIADDGTGFDPDAPRSAQRFGLIGMREHTESLGGRFHLRSSPGEGTAIEVTLP